MEQPEMERPWQTDLLVCAATWMELRAWWPREEERSRLVEGAMAYSPALTFAVTGVGIPASLAFMVRLLQEARPARIWNIGIAGAYPNTGIHIGDIVVGASEVYGDIGFELPDEPGFQSLQDSPFGKSYVEPLRLHVEPEWTAPVPVTNAPRSYSVHRGAGCTVNLCTGTERTGLLRKQRFHADFESMEGAAVAQAAQMWNIPVSEIRAISNIASTRDMQPDNIRLAIANLRDFLERQRPGAME